MLRVGMRKDFARGLELMPDLRPRKVRLGSEIDLTSSRDDQIWPPGARAILILIY